jgi:diaminohydroxyphosphoribosylaminopyrimidine deaminase/5-amino-6-(5-phosphoribosylamino)uracil reductase
MQHALGLAQRGLGNVYPNPAVGCVIAKDGVILGRGWTQPTGRPHAEAMALQQAGSAAAGADLFVTLEPCFHPGRGAPCTQSIIDSGVARVFVAAADPHPRVNGQGIAALRTAGIEVIENILSDDARELNKGFLSVVERGRPWVTLKLAVTADHKLTLGEGGDRWITGEAARRHTHLMRAQYDAILVGMGTVLADNPRLDCRLVGLEKFSPVRIVLGDEKKLPQDSALIKSAHAIPLWFLDGQDLPETLRGIAARGITRLMVEGGARVAQSLLAAGLVDEIALYQSPKVAGAGAIPAPPIPAAFRQVGEIMLDEDVCKTFRL